jgi:diguanylate cyclase (GGDEF)-like protein/PAS domain S-box-containing protein
MASEGWNRERVVELVRGRTIYLRTMHAEDLPVPGWLAAAAGEVGQLSSEERISARHPDDQPMMTQRWLDCLLDPGSPQDFVYRTRIGEEWFEEQCTLVNLLDLPEVGGIVVAAETMGPADLTAVADPEVGGVGDYAQAAWLAYSLDERGVVLHMEGQCEELLGLTPAEAVGRSSFDFIAPEARGATVQMWLELLAQPSSTWTGQLHMLGVEDRDLWLDLTLFHRVMSDGTTDILVVSRDVTEERTRQDALRDSHAEISHLANEFRLLAEEVPAAVFRSEVDGRLTFSNQRWEELQPCLGGPVQRLQDIVADEDQPTLQAAIDRAQAAPTPESGCVELRGRDGRSVLAVGFRFVGEDGSERRSLVGSVTDITDTVALRHRARHDPLTGLLNRFTLEAYLDEIVIARPERAVVLFVDLDGFKAVNDTHGHDAGDDVLRVMAGRLRAAVRPDDHVARYGGDEFVIVADVDAPDAVDALRRRIDGILEEPITFPWGTWRPSASIGAVQGRPDDDVTSLIRRADHAMFRIKRNRQESHTR